jgi:hypothetical protein
MAEDLVMGKPFSTIDLPIGIRLKVTVEVV